jgi:hypothetical protein
MASSLGPPGTFSGALVQSDCVATPTQEIQQEIQRKSSRNSKNPGTKLLFHLVEQKLMGCTDEHQGFIKREFIHV